MTEICIRPYCYGYQITIQPDGKPHVKESGNIKPSSNGLTEQSEVREPLIDSSVNEKENMLTITSKMSGLTMQYINVVIVEDHM